MSGQERWGEQGRREGEKEGGEEGRGQRGKGRKEEKRGKLKETDAVSCTFL